MLIINAYKSVHSCVTKVYILVVQGCTLMHNMIVHFCNLFSFNMQIT